MDDLANQKYFTDNILNNKIKMSTQIANCYLKMVGGTNSERLERYEQALDNYRNLLNLLNTLSSLDVSL